MDRLIPQRASATLARELREINSRIALCLDCLVSDPAQPQVCTRPVTHPEMTKLLSELTCAGKWLRQLPHECGPELAQQLSQYRRNVERVRDLLPSIHGALLRERSRLERERARVESAAQWARRSRETL